ncbi:hypothetical protein M758_9G109600 [Ceratodon purpureus]|nr:hypothetical protein M758_9G109600 [Ceratodon purpureus]
MHIRSEEHEICRQCMEHIHTVVGRRTVSCRVMERKDTVRRPLLKSSDIDVTSNCRGIESCMTLNIDAIHMFTLRT